MSYLVACWLVFAIAFVAGLVAIWRFNATLFAAAAVTFSATAVVLVLVKAP